MLRKEKILVVNPYGIGDLLFATPLLSAIKKNNPSSELHVLIGSRTKEILSHNKDVDNIVVDDRDFWRGQKNGGLRRLLHVRRLRRYKYDTFINLSLDTQYNFFATYLWHIPRRIGFDFKRRGKFLTQKISLPHGFYKKHVARYYLEILAQWKEGVVLPSVSSYSFKLSNNEFQTDISHFFKNTPSKVVTVFPGGGASWGDRAHWKLWPVEKFAKLADMIVQNVGADIVIMGDEAEKKLCESVVASMKEKAVSCAGKVTSLSELGMCMKKAVVVVCNDSGIFHMSLAQEVPTLGIFGPVDESVYGAPSRTPYATCVVSDVSCRPCYYKFNVPSCSAPACLTELSVDKVYLSFKRLYEYSINPVR